MQIGRNENNISEEDYIKLRNARLTIDLIKGVAISGILLYALLNNPLLAQMKQADDELLNTFAKVFSALLILIFVIALVSAIRNGIALIICLTGNDESGKGHRYIELMDHISSNTGRIFQIIMGAAFIIMASFAFKDGPSALAEGSSLSALYIVSGIFIVAGLGLVITGVIGIIRSFKTPADQ